MLDSTLQLVLYISWGTLNLTDVFTCKLLLVISLLLLLPPLFCLDETHESMTLCMYLALGCHILVYLAILVYQSFMSIPNSFNVMCLQIKTFHLSFLSPANSAKSL